MKTSKVGSSQIVSLVLVLTMSLMLVVSDNGKGIRAAGVVRLAGGAVMPSIASSLTTKLDAAGRVSVEGRQSVMSASASGCSGVSFAQPAGSPVGAGTAPSSVAVGDFNLDGKPDLAVTNDLTNNVTILLGVGDGGFTQPIGSPVGAGTSPVSVAVGDFNLDGKPDLAVANFGSNNVTILLGNGSGGFSQAAGSPVGVGSVPRLVAVGDFNLDGKPDLSVANVGSNNVTVLLGNGSGGFTQPAGSPVGAGTNPVSVAVGDFNLDGKPDLAVANETSNNVTILLADGSGGFTQPADSPVGAGTQPFSVAARDFNLDGKPDLVVANRGSNNITILLGNGSGGFTQPAGSPVAVGTSPQSTAIGDFDLDGKPDLAVSNLNSNNVTILFGDGTGALTQPAGSPIGAGANPVYLAAGDFNLDGKPDLAVANLSSNNVMILLNTCNAFPCSGIAFTEPAGSPVAAEAFPASVAVGDFNLDSKPDLAVTNAGSNEVTILLGNGSGGFTQPASSPVSAGTAIAVGDFNQDGKPDLAVAGSFPNKVTILLGNGSGGFTEAAGSPVGVGTQPSSLTIGDFNLDGKLDLAVANTSSNNVTILLGNGSGGFTQPAGSPVGAGLNPSSVAVGDFNQDGKPDLALMNVDAFGYVTILLGNGSGGFTQPAGSPVGVGSFPESVAIGDFNLDGKPDLAVANSGGSNNVTILLGDGIGGFTQPAGSPVGVGSLPRSVAVGDFNLDGEPDLAVVNQFSNNVTVLLGNGSGGFSEPAGSPVGAGAFPSSAAIGDFNLDGKPDLAVANTGSNNVTILLNTCTACTLTCPANITTGTGPGATQCCKVVTFAPTAVPSCGMVTCTPPSGTCFPVGSTTVNCTATPGASCSFSVTVVDDTPPAITCPETITGVAAASCPIANSAPVNFTVTASDNCQVATLVCRNQNNQVVTPPGQQVPVGTTTVTCTATDASGNTATCSFTAAAFSFCLQDETNPGNVVLVNAQTGDYFFCCGGVPIASGRGTLNVRGCIGSIDQTKGDRRVHIQWDTSANNNSGAGTAIMQKLGNVAVCQITERKMTNNMCTCSNASAVGPAKKSR